MSDRIARFLSQKPPSKPHKVSKKDYKAGNYVKMSDLAREPRPGSKYGPDDYFSSYWLIATVIDPGINDYLNADLGGGCIENTDADRYRKIVGTVAKIVSELQDLRYIRYNGCGICWQLGAGLDSCEIEYIKFRTHYQISAKALENWTDTWEPPEGFEDTFKATGKDGESVSGKIYDRGIKKWIRNPKRL